MDIVAKLVTLQFKLREAKKEYLRAVRKHAPEKEIRLLRDNWKQLKQLCSLWIEGIKRLNSR